MKKSSEGKGIKEFEFKTTYFTDGSVDVRVFDGKKEVTNRPSVKKFIPLYIEKLPDWSDLIFYKNNEE